MTNQDLKETEEIKCQEKYGKVFDMVADPVLISDLKGKIFDINKAAEKYGLNRSEAIGKNQLRYISKRCLPKVTADFMKVLSGETCQGKVEIIAPTGKIVMEYKSYPLIQNNKITGMISILRNITERKQKEETLKNSEKRYKYLLDNINEIVLVVSPTGKIIFANQRACNLGGYKKSELEGANIVKFLSKGSIIVALKNLKDEFMGYHKDSTIVDVKKKDGEIRCINFVSQKENFIKEDGKTVGLFLAGQDITKEKQMTEKLKESEKKYRLLAENSIDCIWMLDTDLRFTYLSPSVKRILGFKPEELVGTKVSSYFKKMEFLNVGALAAEAIMNYKTFTQVTFEAKMLNSKNEEVDIEISGRVLLDSRDKLIGLQGTTRDITERKRAEKKIKENEENFRVLYETSADAILTLEPPLWKFTSANLSAVNMFGVKNEKEFFSLEPYEVSPKYQPDGQLSNVKAKKNIMKAMKDGRYFFEWTHKRKNEEDLFVTVLLSRVEGRDQKYLQMTVRDISEQKESKRKLMEKIKELGKMNDLMVNRELKMIKLKKEVNEFCKLLRRKNKYNNKDLNI